MATVFDGLKLLPSKNESGWHPAVKNSFLFLPTAGMRVSSDDLIIELYREIFFEKWTGGAGKRLDPEEMNEESYVFSEEEKYSLYMSRGRVNKNSGKDNFYTPLYPSLARSSWLRKQSDRVIRDYFLRALAQDIHCNGDLNSSSNNEKLKKFHKALIGESREERGIDIAGIKVVPLQECLGSNTNTAKEDSYQKLVELCGSYVDGESSGSTIPKKYNSIFTYQDSGKDSLASRISDDLLELCELESHLDRLQWMRLFQTFLRLSSSVWLLAQMKLTLTLRDALLKIIREDDFGGYDESWIDEAVNSRYVNLFRPTSGLTHQLDEYVISYVKARSELNTLIALVEKYSNADWSKKVITLHSISTDQLSINELFTSAFRVRANINKDLKLESTSIDQALIRFCENFKSWSDTLPFSYTAKGFSEYLRMLRKMTKGDEDGGYLVIPGKQANQGYEVFPGNLMLKLVTYLASKANKNSVLVLSDVEKQFQMYGIDFSEKGSMRPRLIKALQELGLLKGTPDAGDSVAILDPYRRGGI